VGEAVTCAGKTTHKAWNCHSERSEESTLIRDAIQGCESLPGFFPALSMTLLEPLLRPPAR
jgi:hypothetical protein